VKARMEQRVSAE